MHFRDNGEASIQIYYAYKGFKTSGFIDALAGTAGFAEAERAVTHALRLFHDPHLFVFKIGRIEIGQSVEAVFGYVYPKRFGIKL